jgi:hypothetical protein
VLSTGLLPVTGNGDSCHSDSSKIDHAAINKEKQHKGRRLNNLEIKININIIIINKRIERVIYP